MRALSDLPSGYAPFGAGFVSTLALAPVSAKLARRWDLVSYPRPERWSRAATPLLGGLAILSGTTLAVLLPSGRAERLPMLCGAWCCLVVGVLDDAHAFGPSRKLAGVAGAYLVEQIAEAALHPRTAARQSLFNRSIGVIGCLIGATAINMADNMDALAGGCGALTAAAAAEIQAAAPVGSPAAPLAAAVSGACLGFLAWNARPSHIFMGDSGSLPLGYLLSRLSLSQAGSSGDTGPGVMEIPIALLLFTVPLLECVVPVVRRRLGGRSLLRGGTDHLSHALAGVGMPEPVPALALLAVQEAACLAAVTLATRQANTASRERVRTSGAFPWLALASGCTLGLILARALVSPSRRLARGERPS